MGRNLSSLFISQSYQFLLQKSGSELQDGLGNTITGSLAITASLATNATSASYALFATSASYAVNVPTVNTSSLLVTASAAQNVVTFTKGDGSTFPVTIATGSAVTVNTGSLMVTGSATSNVLTFTKGDGSTFNLTVATGSAVTVNTGSLMVTGSVSSNTLTFTKGDGSTFSLLVATGSAVTVNTGSLLVTSSVSNATITFTKGDGTTYTNVVNNVTNATSASYVLNAVSASFASTASYVVTAQTASYVLNAVSASFASTASFVTLAQTASFVTTAQTASNTPNAVTTASISSATITFTKGNATTFPLTVNNVANATSASYAVTSSFASTAATATSASFATTASYAVNATTAATASFIPSNVNLNVASISASTAVFQSASIGFLTTITGSVVNIGDAFIVLNTSNATRYAGMKVVDSGSNTPINYTGSFIFDSQTNDWFYEYSGSDNTNFAVAMFGPEYGTIGSPIYLTNNKLAKGNGGHHLNDSTITDNGTNVVFTTPISGTQISASVGFLGNLVGNVTGTATTASYVLNAVSSSFATTASYALTASFVSNAVSSSFATTASYALTATSASYAVSASQAQNAVTASFALNVTPLNTGSFLVTASVSNATITYTKGDGTTFTNIINNVVNATSASVAVSASYAASSSYALFATGAGGANSATSASYALSASYATNANGAAFINAQTDGFPTARPIAAVSNTGGVNDDEIYYNSGFTINGQSIYSGSGMWLGTPYVETSGFHSTNNGFITGSLNVKGATVISGSLNVSGSVGASNVIQNATDTFTASTKVSEIVTCTQAEYNTVSGSTNAAATLYVITDNTGSGAYIEGAVQGNVSALTISSQTASLDCDVANFFTLTLVSGSNTFINPSNINSGQTLNLRITQASVASGSVSFPSSVKQVSGSAYSPTGTASAVDIVTFISFDGSSLFLSNVKNLV